MERDLKKLDKKLFTIIYLDRNRLEISTGDFQTKSQLPFSATTVLDCEVIDSTQFVAQITKFIDDLKLHATIFTVILSPNVLFTKTFPLNASPEDVESMQAFLSNVPFEYILTHVFRGERDQTVIAANKEFVESVQEAFESRGFMMDAATPAFIFGPNTGLETGLTEMNSKLVTTKRDFCREHSLKSSLSSEPTSSLQGKEQTPKSKEKKQLMILVGIFGVLLLVLIGMIIMTRPKPTTIKPKTRLSQPITHPTLSPTNAPVFAVTNSASESAGTEIPAIQILSAGNSTDSQLAQSLLNRNGYTNITITPNASASAGILLYVAPTVSPALTATLTRLLLTAFPSLIVRNEEYQGSPITLMLGK